MKLDKDGALHNRCNLCTNDTEESYCKKCKESCLKDCSRTLDEISMAYDTELAYECMERVLEGRK